MFAIRYLSSREKTTSIEGNGAEFFASPNFNRPRRNRISFACGNTISWNHRVSVLAGIKKTANSDSKPRLSHSPIPGP